MNDNETEDSMLHVKLGRELIAFIRVMAARRDISQRDYLTYLIQKEMDSRCDSCHLKTVGNPNKNLLGIPTPPAYPAADPGANGEPNEKLAGNPNKNLPGIPTSPPEPAEEPPARGESYEKIVGNPNDKLLGILIAAEPSRPNGKIVGNPNKKLLGIPTDFPSSADESSVSSGPNEKLAGNPTSVPAPEGEENCWPSHKLSYDPAAKRWQIGPHSCLVKLVPFLENKDRTKVLNALNVIVFNTNPDAPGGGKMRTFSYCITSNRHTPSGIVEPATTYASAVQGLERNSGRVGRLLQCRIDLSPLEDNEIIAREFTRRAEGKVFGDIQMEF
jgi:hypothetical protein